MLKVYEIRNNKKSRNLKSACDDKIPRETSYLQKYPLKLSNCRWPKYFHWIGDELKYNFYIDLLMFRTWPKAKYV